MWQVTLPGPPSQLAPVLQMQQPKVCQSAPSHSHSCGTAAGENGGLAGNNLLSSAASPVAAVNAKHNLACRDVAWIPFYREWMSTSQDPQSDHTQANYLRHMKNFFLFWEQQNSCFGASQLLLSEGQVPTPTVPPFTPFAKDQKATTLHTTLSAYQVCFL